MTAPTPPNADDPTVDLVSAYVDGLAAPDEVAVVEASPALMAQVATMRSVTAALGQPASPAPAIKEAHLGAALAEFDSLFGSDQDQADQDQADQDQPVVRSLDEARATRAKRRPRRLNMVAAAAAAVALLFAGVVAVGLNSGGDSFDTVTEATSASSDAAIESSSALVLGDEDASDDSADAAMDDDEAMDEEEAMEDESTAARSEPAMAEAAMEADAEADFAAPMADDAMADDEMADDAMDDAASGAAPIPPIGFLGDFDELAPLEEALQGSLEGSDLTQKALNLVTEVSPIGCPDVIADLTGLSVPTLVGTARLSGKDVELHGSANGEVLVIDLAVCEIVAIIGL